MRAVALAALLGLLGALVILGSGAEARAEVIEKRVAVEPGGTLEVDVDRGQGLRPDPGGLEVASHDANEVWVWAEASGWGASGVKVRVEQGPRAVRVFARVEGAVSWLFGGPQVQIRIRVPRDFSVDVRCSSGPVRVENMRGALRVRTHAGAIEVTQAEGALKLRTSDADVRVAEVKGSVEARTSAGDLELAWIEGAVEARTGSGQIDLAHARGPVSVRSDAGSIELRDVEGPVEARTERGSIHASFLGEPAGWLETRRGTVDVLLPEHAGAEPEAIARRGAVELAPGVEVPGEHLPHQVVGPLNGGGAALRLYTAQGDVRVRAR